MKLPHIHITVQKFLCCSKTKNGSPWLSSSESEASVSSPGVHGEEVPSRGSLELSREAREDQEAQEVKAR